MFDWKWGGASRGASVQPCAAAPMRVASFARRPASTIAATRLGLKRHRMTLPQGSLADSATRGLNAEIPLGLPKSVGVSLLRPVFRAFGPAVFSEQPVNNRRMNGG